MDATEQRHSAHKMETTLIHNDEQRLPFTYKGPKRPSREFSWASVLRKNIQFGSFTRILLLLPLTRRNANGIFRNNAQIYAAYAYNGIDI